MKTIALVVCCDTKQSEADYICRKIREYNCLPLVIDTSTSPDYKSTSDITREAVAEAGGKDWSEMEDALKHDKLELMCRGAAAVANRLYAEKKIDGILSCGGLQNTTIGAAAMKDLPIGFPKFILSTVATGQRTFDQIVGAKDITVMPSISDFAGINVVSKTVINNAVAALTGMVNNEGGLIETDDKPVIGTTLMGATNDGVVNAVKILEEAGKEVVSFHSTGAGGMSMDELITSGVINSAMDLTLHEIVYEYFGGGFGYSDNKRLLAGIEKGIPMLICPAGIDFICQWKNDMFSDIDKRKYNWHNSTLAHVKLNVREAVDISNIIIERLNMSEKGKVRVIIPTDGFRSFSRKGEALYDREVDDSIISTFKEKLRKDIPLKFVDANFMEMKFSMFAAEEMLDLIKYNGRI